MAPKVLHLSTYDANGGAARAAYALHRAMLAQGIPSRMHVARKSTDDPTVTEGARLPFAWASRADRALWKLQRSPIKTWRSPARFGSLNAAQINRSNADVVNLHWVTDGFLSIEEIGRVEKPIIWSMYDMWPFTGTEHYTDDAPDARWRTGYTAANRPKTESGLDLDRWTYERKRRHWGTRNSPFHLVPASSWLQDATRSSALMNAWPITRIPHVVDTNTFAPRDMADARVALDLPQKVPLVLFLSSAGIRDRRKGFDLLEQALSLVKQHHPDTHLVVVGPAETNYASPSGVPIIWLNEVNQNSRLATVYAAANVTVVPSREDNMPLTAMEAQSCGRPVVGFRVGGLADIVEHGISGMLAVPTDTQALASHLQVQLDLSTQDASELATRGRAIQTWSPAVITLQYSALYEQALA